MMNYVPNDIFFASRADDLGTGLVQGRLVLGLGTKVLRPHIIGLFNLRTPQTVHRYFCVSGGNDNTQFDLRSRGALCRGRRRFRHGYTAAGDVDAFCGAACGHVVEVDLLVFWVVFCNSKKYFHPF